MTDWRYTNGQFANLCLSTGGHDTIYLLPRQGAVSGFLKSVKCNLNNCVFPSEKVVANHIIPSENVIG